MAIAAYAGYYPPEILYLFVVTGLLAVALYAKDKWAVIHNQGRIRESTLHVIAIADGPPGAAAAQYLFNHTCGKYPCRIVFWITVTIQQPCGKW